MSQYVVNGARLTAIADAIRAKTGGSGTLTLDQMPTEISGIETGIPDGYIIPSGSVTITENGEYDIAEKASVVVAVPETEITLQNKEITENGTYTADTGYDGLGQVTVNVASSGGGDIDTLINKSITEISSNVTSIGNYAFHSCSKLTSANFPNATSMGNYAFNGCSKLKSAFIPLATSISNSMFDNCYALTSADFPLATSIGSYAFRSCFALASINIPLATSIGTYAFYSCRLLKSADFPLVTSIGNLGFYGCNSLTALILRSETMCTLGSNVFNNCNHFLGTTHSTYNPNGDKDGYIYVPRALVDTYKAASNWSTYASQFRALEDYTVDGTTAGALDESKI